jgi:hypothetical protein
MNIAINAFTAIFQKKKSYSYVAWWCSVSAKEYKG